MSLDDRIKIFLTDQAKSRAGSKNVTGLSKEVMVTVADFYKKPENADGFRKKYGMTRLHRAGWDSGGFQFLMGKLKMDKTELLPCGIEVPASAQDTIDLYKRVGVEKKDYPIQLDLPPRYDQTPNERKQLITRSVGYYYEMASELPITIPVVHGWTLDEMKFNLKMLEDPDEAELAMGTFLTETRGNWTMGKLNPHKGVGSGTFMAPRKSAVDSIHPRKKVAVGSNKPLHNSEYYLPYTDNHANKDRDKLAIGSYKGLTHGVNYKEHVQGAIATPMPGRMDLGIDGSFIDKLNNKIVATPAPSTVDAGIRDPSNMPTVAAPKKRVAIGSFVANTTRGPGEKLALGTFAASYTGPIDEKLAIGTYAATSTKPIRELLTYTKPETKKKKKPKRVGYKIIIDRIATALNFLKEDYDVFMLGGASPHMVQQCFLAGAQWTDTSAWRIKGMMAEIYIWGHSSGKNAFHIGTSKSSKKKKMDDESRAILKEYLREETHPFSGMTVDRFLTIGYMRMKDWKKTWKENEWEVKPGPMRMLHNAWVLKEVIEPIARDYATDPDGYYKYLVKCLAPRPILSKRLRNLYEKIKQPYVQTKLGVYLK